MPQWAGLAGEHTEQSPFGSWRSAGMFSKFCSRRHSLLICEMNWSGHSASLRRPDELCLSPPCSSALGISPKTNCDHSEWGCYVCNGPHMPLDRTTKLKLLLQWDVCHKSFPKGSQPSVTIGNCPRKLTHRKGLGTHMVLELQVHNQLEPLL